MNNIKYLILDFGKVLAGPTTGDWFMTPKFLELVNTTYLEPTKFAAAVKKFGYLLDEKLLTETEEYQMFLKFYRNLLLELNYPHLSTNLIHSLAYNFTYEEDKYTFYPNISKELNKLSQKYTLLLLTDNWPCVIRILKKHDLYSYFQQIYISSIYGVKKEDKVFFDYPLIDFNIQPGEALFIDDNETLLDIAVQKKIKVKLMDRQREIKTSKYPIIHNLENL